MRSLSIKSASDSVTLLRLGPSYLLSVRGLDEKLFESSGAVFLRTKLGKSLELRDSRPVRLTYRAALIIDKLNLLLVFVPLKENLLKNHFCKHAPNRPGIHCVCVVSRAQKQLRGPVPQGYNSVSVMNSLISRIEDACKTKIREFYLAC